MSTTHEITIIAGTHHTETLEPIVSLTGIASALVHIREKLSDATPIITIDSTEETAHGSTITIDKTDHEIVIAITPAETLNLERIQAGRTIGGYWDLMLTDATDKVTIYYPASKCTIQAVCTRPTEGD